MRYHFEVTRDEDGIYLGECIELDSCISEGSSIEELISNLTEALEGVLRVNFGTNFAHSLPDESLDTNSELLQIEVSEDIAFSVQLRNYRIKKNYTQNHMKDLLHMRSRNSYVKLESQGNPTIKTLGKLLKVFPDFPIMDCFSY